MVMRVFVAGGTGVIGRRLVPQLMAGDHQVTATTTSAGKLGLLEQLAPRASRLRSASGYPVSRSAPGPSRRGGSPRGWPGCSPARWRSG
jgi:NAD(P)-dependent dehydrogenase (short-subunit alcohol dehydrogenase family)